MHRLIVAFVRQGLPDPDAQAAVEQEARRLTEALDVVMNSFMRSGFLSSVSLRVVDSQRAVWAAASSATSCSARVRALSTMRRLHRRKGVVLLIVP